MQSAVFAPPPDELTATNLTVAKLVRFRLLEGAVGTAQVAHPDPGPHALFALPMTVGFGRGFQFFSR